MDGHSRLREKQSLPVSLSDMRTVCQERCHVEKEKCWCMENAFHLWEESVWIRR